MSTALIGDLLKPSAPKLCTEPNHCANCGRYLPNEIREAEGLCFRCELVTEHQAQVWECSACETVRMWGFGRPYDTLLKQLGCVGCGQVTAHTFAYVDTSRIRGGSLAEKQAQMRERMAAERS